LLQSGGERRPSRHGVNTSINWYLTPINLKQDFYIRRNAAGGNISIGQTTWRAGRRERCRKAAVSGDRAGMAWTHQLIGI
jgi:hypothetical protein